MSYSNNFFSYGRVVTIHHEAISIMNNDLKGAIFLEHLAFWCEPSINKADPDGWVYKTSTEWEGMFLSRRDVERARRHLKSIGILYEEKRGVPPVLWYKIDYEELRRLRAELSIPPQDVQQTPRVVPYRTSNVYDRTQVKYERTTTVNNAFNNSSVYNSEKRTPYSPPVGDVSLATDVPQKKYGGEDQGADPPNPPKRKRGKNEYTEAFEAFWLAYKPKPDSSNKLTASRAWARLSKLERERVMSVLPNHPVFDREVEFVPHPATFLNQRRWEDPGVAERVAKEEQSRRDRAIYEEWKAKRNAN